MADFKLFDTPRTSLRSGSSKSILPVIVVKLIRNVDEYAS